VCTKLGRINGEILGYQLRRELHQIKRGQEIKILVQLIHHRKGMVGIVVSNDVLLLVFDKNQSRVYHQCCFILLVYFSLFFCAILLAEENPLCQ
jgi:hypothetical protein